MRGLGTSIEERVIVMGNITIKDIAKMCGVSVTTVSRALNNYPGINQNTKEKIMQVVHENQFVPNNSARNLKRLENHSIAVLVKGISNPFFQPMFGMLEKLIHKHKYTFILQGVNDTEDELDVARELVLEKKPKGIIFLGGYFHHTKEKIKQLDIPCVIGAVGDIDNSSDICSSVHVDDVKESYKIIDYLCRIGHRKIAILAASKEDLSISSQRVSGYRQALLDHQIPVDEELICYTKPGEDPYTMERGYTDIKNLLKKREDFTAVFAISDAVAIGVCRALKEEGKRIPGDFSVVGFDGLEIASYYIPTITTIKQPVEEMARAMAEMLFLEIEEGSPIQHKVFEGELLVRESSGALSQE